MCQPIIETPAAALQERAFDIQPQNPAHDTAPPPEKTAEPPVDSGLESSLESLPENVALAATQETATSLPPTADKSTKPPGEKRRKAPSGGYKPAQVLQRVKGRNSIYKAYLADSEALLLQIRLLGLGPALALLQAQSENKSQRRVYWDLSQWIFKAQRIRGRNSRSLLDSVVYGDNRFLVKATHAAVQFLEAVLQLSQNTANQPQTRSKSQS